MLVVLLSALLFARPTSYPFIVLQPNPPLTPLPPLIRPGPVFCKSTAAIGKPL